jgi:antitoxin component YwqK of YwqJK toxin-antitoxin module
MIGYTYQSFYIITIEVDDDEYKSYCDEYKNSFWKKVVYKENATYVTEKFKIIEIEDLQYNKYDNSNRYLISKNKTINNIGNYSKNNIYTEKINFWLNKQIARDKKIRDSRDYKKLATYEDPSNNIYVFHNLCVPEYKRFLTKYFYDIDGISGIYKQYYPDGVLEKECYHNNDKYEGEHKTYYMNGKIKEITTYINGIRRGKNIEYSENGNFIHRNYISENKYEVIEYNNLI